MNEARKIMNGEIKSKSYNSLSEILDEIDMEDQNLLDLKITNQFKKDLKKIKKRGLNISKLDNIISKLRKQEQLEDKYRDHALIGNYIGFRECHIEPDWLLIYAINNEELILTASRTGTHSDLFQN